jgi:hypothetical protein
LEWISGLAGWLNKVVDAVLDGKRWVEEIRGRNNGVVQMRERSEFRADGGRERAVESGRAIGVSVLAARCAEGGLGGG